MSAVQYYWQLCKRFGKECYETWITEVVSAFVGGIATVGVDWVRSGKSPSFIDAALGAGFVFLAFAVGHAVRSPWLLYRETLDDKRKPTKAWDGALGIVVGALVLGTIGILWFVFYVRAASNIRLSTIVDPGVQNAQIAQLREEVRTLKGELNNRQSFGQLSARSIAMSKEIKEHITQCNGPLNAQEMKETDEAMRAPQTQRSELINKAFQKKEAGERACWGQFLGRLDDARYLVNEMFVYLSPGQVNELKRVHGQAETVFATGQDVGAFSEEMVSEYLYDVAKMVPPKQH